MGISFCRAGLYQEFNSLFISGKTMKLF